MEESYLIFLKLLLWTPVKPRFNQLSLFHPLYSAETRSSRNKINKALTSYNGIYFAYAANLSENLCHHDPMRTMYNIMQPLSVNYNVQQH